MSETKHPRTEAGATSNPASSGGAAPLAPASPGAFWLKVAVGLLLVGFVGVKGIDYAIGASADRRWNAFQQEVLASGQPLTIEQIEQARPAIPPDENSALVLQRLQPAIEAAFLEEPGERVLVFQIDADLMGGIPNSAIEPSTAFFDERRHLLEELRPILKMRRGRFELDPSAGIDDFGLPSIAYIRQVSKLAALGTIVNQLDRRRRPPAAEYALLQFALAGTLTDDPRWVIALVQRAISQSAVRSLEQLLRTGNLDLLTIQRFERAIDERLESDTLLWALLGERAYLIDVFEIARRGAPYPPGFEETESFPDNEFRKTSAHWLLPRTVLSIVRESQRRIADWMGLLIDAGEERSKLASALDRIEMDRDADKVALLASQFLPDFRRSIDVYFRIVAELRAAKAALAAERYFMKNGKLPSSFEAFVPEYLDAVPIDPFNSEPMRIAVTRDGIVIYSVHVNLKDDGGKLEADHHHHHHHGHDHEHEECDEEHGESEERPDVGFRLFNPMYRGVMTYSIGEP